MNCYTEILQHPQKSKLYFIGIGGISMCGLAELAKQYGFFVVGSDIKNSEHISHLQAIQIDVLIGQEAKNIDIHNPDLVIYTAAIADDHPELKKARDLGIPTIDRATFLGYITSLYQSVINVAGTHGKTTTTAMCATILQEANLDPTVHLGASLSSFGNKTIQIGSSNKLLISEACEYKNSYHHFESTEAVILNIDLDHLDFFKDLDDIICSFSVFTRRIRPNGTLLLHADSPHLTALLNEINKQYSNSIPFHIKLFSITDSSAFIYADHIQFNDGFPSFDVYIDQAFFTHITLQVPGLHNVQNALASIGLAYLKGANAINCKTALAHFTGADGRFTIKGKYKGATIITDYAHHPASTNVTIQAATHIPHNKMIVVYQPLTFSRVRDFFDDYVNVLLPCDTILMYEIFSDREKETYQMSSKLIADEINKRGGHCIFIKDQETLYKKLDEVVSPNDFVLFLGPEEVRSFADHLIYDPV